MKENGLAEYLEGQRKSTGEFLAELLAVPSESGNEKAALDLLCARLNDFGVPFETAPVSDAIKTHRDYSDPVKDLDYSGRYNIAARSPGSPKMSDQTIFPEKSRLIRRLSDDGKVIALNTHIDVVPPSPGQAKAYTPEERGGRIYARGACDAKGQIAAAVLALRAAAEFGCKNTLEAHFVIEEELGGNGTLSLLEEHFAGAKPADVLINLEPSDLKLKPSVRGAVWFDMTFSGVAGHAGSANTENAIYKAVDAVQALRTYHAALYKTSKDTGRFKGVVSPMPLNVGMLQAGVWPSMAPSQARLRGIIGFLPDTTKARVMADIDKLFGTGVHYDYRHDGFELPDGHFLLDAARKAMREAGLDDTPAAMTASTDAIFYVEKGVPSLVFGPGSLSAAHSADENIALNDILKAAEVLTRLADAPL